MKSSGIEPRSSRRWTVVIVRRFGRISSHEISGFWFKTFIFLLILIIAGAAYLFYQNQKLTEERQRLLAKLVLPPTETEAEKPVLPAPKPATTTTEEQKTQEKEQEQEAVPDSTVTTEVEVETTLKAEESTTTTAVESTTTTEATMEETTTTVAEVQDQSESIGSEKVDVSEVKIVPLQDPKGIKIAYKLMNQGQEGKKITGYTFVLAKNDELEQPVVEVFPSTASVEAGLPVNHKKGVAFSIYQFKTIRGRIYTKESIKEVQILVYDQEGRLIYRQNYPMPNA